MEKLEDHVVKSRTMANAESPHFENMMDSIPPPTLQLKSEIKKEEVESESVDDIVTEPYQFALAPPSDRDPGGDDGENTGLPMVSDHTELLILFNNL